MVKTERELRLAAFNERGFRRRLMTRSQTSVRAMLGVHVTLSREI